MNKEFVEMVAYDGTLARVPSDKVTEFTNNQDYIKKEIAKGKTLQDILSDLKKGGNE